MCYKSCLCIKVFVHCINNIFSELFRHSSKQWFIRIAWRVKNSKHCLYLIQYYLIKSSISCVPQYNWNTEGLGTAWVPHPSNQGLLFIFSYSSGLFKWNISWSKNKVHRVLLGVNEVGFSRFYEKSEKLQIRHCEFDHEYSAIYLNFVKQKEYLYHWCTVYNRIFCKRSA